MDYYFNPFDNLGRVSRSQVLIFILSLNYVGDGSIKTGAHTPALLKESGVQIKRARKKKEDKKKKEKTIGSGCDVFPEDLGFVAICGHFHQVVKSLLRWHVAM